MCGRFVLTSTTEHIRQSFGVDDVPSIAPRYNIAPTQDVLVIRQNGGGSRYAGMLRWGLIPHWAKDPAIGNKMINARSETAHEKPSFRNSIHYHRCLIPASGFIEWSQQNGSKQPWYIHRKDGELLAFAGIWDSWQGAEGTIDSCSILTTSANNLVAKIHDRMPVVLSVSEYDQWLDRQITEAKQLEALYAPFPADLLEAIPISTKINNPRFDSRDCLEPLS
ncbi:MAG: SOS response-associated peptidase [Desulfoarculaceae bacterium]|nr:SOS response-associated peptidase [Desulfoarculaceae bacterium]